MNSYPYRIDAVAGTDCTRNIFVALPTGGFVDFSSSSCELRAQFTAVDGTTSTVLDIQSGVSNANGSLILGASALTVYDNSSNPPIQYTVPAGSYWTLTLPKVFTTAQAGNELCYVFYVTFSDGSTQAPLTGTIVFSSYIQPLLT